MNPIDIYLKAYLEQLEAQLGDLPPDRRAEILIETRAHLEAMIAARRADGVDDGQAWRRARAAFGDAELTGRDLAREWKRAPRVETEGTPLSGREKLRLFARPVGLSMLCFGILYLWLSDERLKSYWVHALVALVSFGCLTFGCWRNQRRRGKWTPATIFSYAVFCLLILQANLDLTFGAHWRGTAWDNVNRYSPFVMLLLLTASTRWRKREDQERLPWRQMPSYGRNPIAAEETFRLAPKIGLAMGVSMGCIGNLMMVKFFGWPLALGLCAGEIALALLVSRWLGRAS